MDKNSKIQDILKKAQQLNALSTTEVVEEIKEIEKVEDNSLPTTYINTKGIMLNSKDIMTKTSYLDKLEIDHSKYEHLKFTPEQAKRIQTSMSRLSSGVTAVVPLICTGPSCPFARTCLEIGTEVLTYSSNSGVKTIETLVVGDIVYSFNLEREEIEHDYVEAVTYMGFKLVYEIKTHTGEKIKATVDHPFLTEDSKGNFIWLSLEDGLKIGHKLFLADVKTVDDTLDSRGDLLIDVIESIEIAYKTEVYDITVRNNSNFFANNILLHNCPYQQEGKAPIGEQCLVETNLIGYWMERYFDEFNLDENSITDLHMVSKLCEYDIYEMRVTKYLAEQDQNLLTDFISSYDEQGNPISNKAISAAFEAKERIARMRSKTLNELLATRESKLKVQQVTNENTASTDLAKMKEKLDQLIKEKYTTTIDGKSKRIN